MASTADGFRYGCDRINVILTVQAPKHTQDSFAEGERAVCQSAIRTTHDPGFGPTRHRGGHLQARRLD